MPKKKKIVLFYEGSEDDARDLNQSDYLSENNVPNEDYTETLMEYKKLNGPLYDLTDHSNYTFGRNALELSKRLKDHYNEVEIIKIDSNIFDKQMESITDDDDFAILGHHANRYGGVPVDTWNKKLKEKKDYKGTCYLGTCGGADVAEWINEETGIRVYSRPDIRSNESDFSNSWYGASNMGDSVEEIFFGKSLGYQEDEKGNYESKHYLDKPLFIVTDTAKQIKHIPEFGKSGLNSKYLNEKESLFDPFQKKENKLIPKAKYGLKTMVEVDNPVKNDNIQNTAPYYGATDKRKFEVSNDLNDLDEIAFRDKYKISKHRWKYDNIPSYKEYTDASMQKSNKEVGTVTRGITGDLDRGDVTPHNAQFMYPQLSGSTQAGQTKFSNEVIEAALPIPGLNKIGKVPGLIDDALGALGKVAKPITKADDVGKQKWGMSIDELDTPNIISKSKDVEKNVNLGIGRYDLKHKVNYDNGLELHVYNSKGSDDVFLMYDPKTEQNIAYMRNSTIDKNMNKIPTNTFHIKADADLLGKDKVKFMMEEMKKILPKKHIITEPSTISTDGIKVWNQQGKHGYAPTGVDIRKAYISDAGTEQIFKGLKYKTSGDKFGAITFADDIELGKGVEAFKNYLTNNNLKYSIETVNNKIKVILPELQRTFSFSVPIGTGAYLKSREQNSTNKKQIPKAMFGLKTTKEITDTNVNNNIIGSGTMHKAGEQSGAYALVEPEMIETKREVPTTWGKVSPFIAPLAGLALTATGVGAPLAGALTGALGAGIDMASAKRGLKTSGTGKKIISVEPIIGRKHEQGGENKLLSSNNGNNTLVEAESGEFKITLSDGSQAIFNQHQMNRVKNGESVDSVLSSIPTVNETNKAVGGVNADEPPYSGNTNLYVNNLLKNAITGANRYFIDKGGEFTRLDPKLPEMQIENPIIGNKPKLKDNSVSFNHLKPDFETNYKKPNVADPSLDYDRIVKESQQQIIVDQNKIKYGSPSKLSMIDYDGREKALPFDPTGGKRFTPELYQNINPLFDDSDLDTDIPGDIKIKMKDVNIKPMDNVNIPGSYNFEDWLGDTKKAANLQTVSNAISGITGMVKNAALNNKIQNTDFYEPVAPTGFTPTRLQRPDRMDDVREMSDKTFNTSLRALTESGNTDMLPSLVEVNNQLINQGLAQQYQSDVQTGNAEASLNAQEKARVDQMNAQIRMQNAQGEMQEDMIKSQADTNTANAFMQNLGTMLEVGPQQEMKLNAAKYLALKNEGYFDQGVDQSMQQNENIDLSKLNYGEFKSLLGVEPIKTISNQKGINTPKINVSNPEFRGTNVSINNETVGQPISNEVSLNTAPNKNTDFNIPKNPYSPNKAIDNKNTDEFSIDGVDKINRTVNQENTLIESSPESNLNTNAVPSITSDNAALKQPENKSESVNTDVDDGYEISDEVKATIKPGEHKQIGNYIWLHDYDSKASEEAKSTYKRFDIDDFTTDPRNAETFPSNINDQIKQDTNKLSDLKKKYPDVKEGYYGYPETYRKLKAKGLNDETISRRINDLIQLEIGKPIELSDLNYVVNVDGKELTDQLFMQKLGLLNENITKK